MRALLLICPLLLVGCVHLEHYPRSWEPLVSEDRDAGCAGIAGTYLNKGENVDGVEVALGSWLEPVTNYWNAEGRARERDVAAAKWIELMFVPKGLQVTAIGGDRRWEWVYGYSCRRGKLHVRRSGHMSGDNVALVGSEGVDLIRTRRHLIVETRGVEVGIAMLIPVAGYSRSWGRFAPAENAGLDSRKGP